MQGSVLKFYWDNILDDTDSTFSVTSTSTGDFSLSYITNWLEVNRWKASSSTIQYFIYETSTTKQADYMAICGHNLNTAGANITLQCTTSTSFAAPLTLFAETPVNDRLFLKEFTNPGAGIKAWRLIVQGQTTAISIAIMSLGTRTELDYITPGNFDPYSQKIDATINKTVGKYIAGIHVHSIERNIDISLANKTTTVYNKVKEWWETHQLNNFAMAWDITNSSTDIWLVHADETFKNPITIDQYRNINIKLTGRKE